LSPALAPLAIAQTAPAPSAAAAVTAPAVETPVELSPFVTTVGSDKGYVATSSLAGSRVNTPLKDIAAQIDVMTPEFLNDIGATTIDEAVVFSTYNWGDKRLYIDVLGEYNLSRRFALFANLRNVNDATEDFEIAGPSTPAHAQFRQRIDFAALWTFGIKGRF